MCQPESRIRLLGWLRPVSRHPAIGKFHTTQGNRMTGTALPPHFFNTRGQKSYRITSFSRYYLIVPLVRKILDLCLV